MKMLQGIILFWFFFTGCIDNQTINKRTIEQEDVAKDTLLIIASIKKQYVAINSNISFYDKVEKGIWGESTEGGVAIGYYKGNLKKALVTFYGETGKTVNEYYFNNEGLFFVFRKEYLYNKPIYIKGSKVLSSEENRYYFFKNNLIRWAEKNNKIIGSNRQEFKDESKSIREDAEKVKKLLGNFTPLNIR